jgi:hypothetical protein
VYAAEAHVDVALRRGTMRYSPLVSDAPAAAPTRSPLAGVLGGIGLTLVLHFFAGIAILIAGSILAEERRGSELGLAVIIWGLVGLPLWQWFYVAPIALLTRRAGYAALSKGFWIAGAGGTALAAVVAGGVVLFGVLAEVQSKVVPPTPTPVSTALSVRGTVESFDGDRLVVMTDDGAVALHVHTGTEYVFLKAPAGAEHRTAEIVKPGVRVSCDAWKGLPEPSTSMVRVVEDGRAMPDGH